MTFRTRRGIRVPSRTDSFYIIYQIAIAALLSQNNTVWQKHRGLIRRVKKERGKWSTATVAAAGSALPRRLTLDWQRGTAEGAQNDPNATSCRTCGGLTASESSQSGQLAWERSVAQRAFSLSEQSEESREQRTE